MKVSYFEICIEKKSNWLQINHEPLLDVDTLSVHVSRVFFCNRHGDAIYEILFTELAIEV